MNGSSPFDRHVDGKEDDTADVGMREEGHGAANPHLHEEHDGIEDHSGEHSETGFHSTVHPVNSNGRTNGRNGPWPTSSDEAYSRKVHQKSSVSISNKAQSRPWLLLVAIGGGALVLGLVIGILIGLFALNKGSDSTSTQAVSRTAAGKTTTGLPPYVEPQTIPNPPATPRPSPQTCPPCTTTASVPCNICPLVNPMQPDPTIETTSVFAPLTPNEMTKVNEYMLNNDLADEPITLESRRIVHIYLFPPDKKASLNFLDNGGPFPGRFARVHVFRGGNSPPDVMEYKIGPLHVKPAKMTVAKLFKDGEISFNRRPHDPMESNLKINAVLADFEAMKPMLQDSFDGKSFSDGIDVTFPTHQTSDPNDRVSSVHMFFTTSGMPTMRILPVQCIIHHPGTNMSAWYSSDFYYLNQGPYNSGQELYDAYAAGKVRKMKMPSGYFANSRFDFSLNRNYSMPTREGGDIPPPRTYEPMGPRYGVLGQRVKWMGWTFEFSADPIRGPGIYNLRFLGKRIAFEISLQDVTLIYASGSTGAGMTPAIISDSEYMLGGFFGPRPGLDCPERTNILNSTIFDDGTSYEIPAACIFEADAQRPLWRHFHGAPFGLTSSYLVIRAPMVLGNYDYTAEWRFYLDGHVDTTITASGFLYTSVWDAENPLNGNGPYTPFGYRIGDYLVGSVHDHSFQFRVDLDIYDANNSFEIVHWKAGDVLTALRTQSNVSEVPPFFPFNYTRYVEYEKVQTETGVVLDTRHPQFWTFVNEREKNAWGVKRGYRVVPITSAAETLPEQHPFLKAWSNLKYHCAVTRRKDEEPYADYSLYDLPFPTDPIGGLDKFMDGESIQDEDLVAWITAKFAHIPSAEDSPMTNGIERGFTLQPFHFFDGSATFDIDGHYTAANPYAFQACYDRFT